MIDIILLFLVLIFSILGFFKGFKKEVKSLVNRTKRKTATLKSLQNTILGKSLNERMLREFRNSAFSYLK